MSARHFHWSAGLLTIFYLFLSLEFQAAGFCISGRKTCMTARHFHQFYYFMSIGFQAGGFCILGRKTCMSARHFHWSAGRLTIFYLFLSLQFQAGGLCISGRKTCMSARHFHQAAGQSTDLLTVFFFNFTISFPLGSRQEDFASQAAKPAGRPAMFTGRPDNLLIYSLFSYFSIF